MRREDFHRSVSTRSSLENLGEETTTILAVGDPEEWLRAGQNLPCDNDIAFVAFNEIDSDLLERMSPSVVMSPLLATGFDCIDLAELLVAVGYNGRYRAVTQKLPNPSLVVREIRQLCPGLDFDLLDLN